MEVSGNEDDRKASALIRLEHQCAIVRGVMTEHLSPSSLERFPDRSVDAETMLCEVRHLEVCPECLEAWRRACLARRGRDPDPAVSEVERPVVSSELVLRHLVEWARLDWLAEEHLTADELAALVVGRPLEEPEMADLHLQGCPECSRQLAVLTLDHVLDLSLGSRFDSAPEDRPRHEEREEWGRRSRRIALVLIIVLLLPVLSYLACLTCYVYPDAAQLMEFTPEPAPRGTPPSGMGSAISSRLTESPDGPAAEGGGSAPSDLPGLRSSGSPLAIDLRDGERRIILDRPRRLTGLAEMTRDGRRPMAQSQQRRDMPASGTARDRAREPRNYRPKRRAKTRRRPHPIPSPVGVSRPTSPSASGNLVKW